MKPVPLDPKLVTQAKLEQAQDAFVVGLRRLRALEELAAQLRAPLDLEHAHELFRRIVRAPLQPRTSVPIPRDTSIEAELRAARERFHQLREALRCAEDEANLAA